MYDLRKWDIYLTLVLTNVNANVPGALCIPSISCFFIVAWPLIWVHWSQRIAMWWVGKDEKVWLWIVLISASSLIHSQNISPYLATNSLHLRNKFLFLLKNIITIPFFSSIRASSLKNIGYAHILLWITNANKALGTSHGVSYQAANGYLWLWHRPLHQLWSVKIAFSVCHTLTFATTQR